MYVRFDDSPVGVGPAIRMCRTLTLIPIGLASCIMHKTMHHAQDHASRMRRGTKTISVMCSSATLAKRRVTANSGAAERHVPPPPFLFFVSRTYAAKHAHNRFDFDPPSSA
jgi:hypothetical protein